MKKLMPLISFIGLALVLAPAVLYLATAIEKDTMKTVMLVGTVLWFVTAPRWMGKDTTESV